MAVPPYRWTRRQLLATAAGATLAVGSLPGCSWFRDPPPLPEPPDPLASLLRSTRALATRYELVLAEHPDLASRLGPLHATHVAHVAALTEVIGAPEPRPAAASTGGAWVPPAEPVAGLREAELAAQREATAACLSAPADRAPLLGSITAARAAHVEVLS